MGRDRAPGNPNTNFIRLRLSNGRLMVVSNRFWNDYLFNTLKPANYIMYWGDESYDRKTLFNRFSNT